MIWGILILTLAFAATVLTLLSEPLPVLIAARRALAGRVVARLGLLDVYLETCADEDLALIRHLRHAEQSYHEAMIDFLIEEISLAELCLLLVFGRVHAPLQDASGTPSLHGPAQAIAHYHIELVRARLRSDHTLPHLPRGLRLRSRWRVKRS